MSEDEESIRALWQDPSFSGAFTGIGTFQAALQAEKNIHISRNDLIRIMSKDPNFVLESYKLKKKFARRPMTVHGYCMYVAAKIT